MFKEAEVQPWRLPNFGKANNLSTCEQLVKFLTMFFPRKKLEMFEFTQVRPVPYYHDMPRAQTCNRTRIRCNCFTCSKLIILCVTFVSFFHCFFPLDSVAVAQLFDQGQRQWTNLGLKHTISSNKRDILSTSNTEEQHQELFQIH